MNTEKLNSWLGLLANIGVIAGIVILSFEIRQSTEVAISSAELDVSNMQTEFHLRLAENADLARLFNVGLRNPEQLTDVEIAQFEFMVAGSFLFMEGAYKQYQRGFLPEDGWTPYEGLIHFYMDRPLSRSWWFTRSTVFSPEFEMTVSDIAGPE
jgi:hypothetical protein